LAAETLGAKNPTIKVSHEAQNDWAVRFPERIPVKPGDIFEISSRVKVEGEGSATTGVVVYAENDVALSWTYGGRQIREKSGATVAESKFVVPEGAVAIQPRMIGDGPATVRFADYVVKKIGSVFGEKGAKEEKIVFENDYIAVEAESLRGSFAVLDKRTGRRQAPVVEENTLFVKNYKRLENGVRFEFLDGRSFLEFAAEITLEPNAPELVVAVSADPDAPLAEAVSYPYPFATKTTERVVLPVNAGISFPTTEKAPLVDWIHMYGGHGLCMSFWGVIDDKTGPVGGYATMALVETPDDANVLLAPRPSDGDDGEKTLSVAQQWRGQKGRFGYARKMRLVFFDKGGFVAICKRYREHAKAVGLLRTFRDKIERNPARKAGFDRLIGAANIWTWERDRLNIIEMLREAGIDRILWSAGGTAEEIAAMNEIDGVLTSRYDIYQDAMDP
ncbi:MAG: hypothetical protein HUK22_08430, partial [Thermoguttaceae bacterium]|nr:hypothetical protein [Thermoguttaceae bacterium]